MFYAAKYAGLNEPLFVADFEALHAGGFQFVGARIVADGTHRTRRMHVSKKGRVHFRAVLLKLFYKAVYFVLYLR